MCVKSACNHGVSAYTKWRGAMLLFQGIYASAVHHMHEVFFFYLISLKSFENFLIEDHII